MTIADFCIHDISMTARLPEPGNIPQRYRLIREITGQMLAESLDRPGGQMKYRRYATGNRRRRAR
jgi:hypothetical protein